MTENNPEEETQNVTVCGAKWGPEALFMVSEVQPWKDDKMTVAEAVHRRWRGNNWWTAFQQQHRRNQKCFLWILKKEKENGRGSRWKLNWNKKRKEENRDHDQMKWTREVPFQRQNLLQYTRPDQMMSLASEFHTQPPKGAEWVYSLKPSSVMVLTNLH